jgi:predicted HAD superfamily phosphohydrolase
MIYFVTNIGVFVFLEENEMKLKHATIAVLISISLSAIFGIIEPFLPAMDIGYKLINALSQTFYLAEIFR